jgi:hypothetical protein
VASSEISTGIGAEAIRLDGHLSFSRILRNIYSTKRPHEQTFLAAATNIVSSNHKDLQNRPSSSLIDLQWRANYLATHV